MSIKALQNPFSRSLSLHLLLMLFLAIYATLAPKLKIADEPISISLIDSKTEKDRSRQVVQPSEGDVAKEAKKDAYLSDKTRVAKEERSANKIGSATTSGQPRAAVKTSPKSFNLSDLGVKIHTRQDPNQEKRWAENALGENVRGGQYIQGLKEGETSALNTKEFVFFSYFDRVRRQLDATWQPLVRSQIERLYKNGRHLAAQSDFVTRTMITLNSRGEIVRVQLLQESGALDLDSAAIGALNKAGPYPNPPKGLLDQNGQAQIRWDFVLKT